MNAIKLPVTPQKRLEGWMWELIDGDGTTICNTGASEQLAREIATDINRRNSHDALVEALEKYKFGDINGATARAALAKVEKLNAESLLTDAKRYANEL